MEPLFRDSVLGTIPTQFPPSSWNNSHHVLGTIPGQFLERVPTSLCSFSVYLLKDVVVHDSCIFFALLISARARSIASFFQSRLSILRWLLRLGPVAVAPRTYCTAEFAMECLNGVFAFLLRSADAYHHARSDTQSVGHIINKHYEKSALNFLP